MDENKYSKKIVEFHILQSFPVSCLNRDDVGSPKTAFIGGVPRARVSSQCWKRAIRLAMRDYSGVNLAMRTKYFFDKIYEACISKGATEEQAKKCAYFKDKDKKDKKGKAEEAKEETALNAEKKSKTLYLITDQEIKYVAKEYEENGWKPKESPISMLKKFRKNADLLDGMDIALFGRMMADAPNLNVEAAASFSHAISTHKAANEIDFFTAVDDLQKEGETGSAHMGSLEYNSATYYRYIQLDLGQLYENLGRPDDTLMANAVEAFAKALFIAVPIARQKTQAGYSSWDYARILIRKGQGVQLSFETPVRRNSDGGYLQPSIDAVRNQLEKREKQYGSLFGKIADFEFGTENGLNIDALIEAIKGKML